MEVKDLIKQIEDCKKDYGDDFLDWEVYTEQIDEGDKKDKKSNPQWHWIKDSGDWEYIECAGFWTKFPKERIFTINVNY